MLSHDGRRRLEAIERWLVSDDPRLAERFNQWTRSGASRRVAFHIRLTIVLGVLGTLVGIVSWSSVVVVVFLTTLVVGLVRRKRASRRAVP